MSVWQLQEAKAKLSELIKKALQFGPQEISIRGVVQGVFISKQDYDKLTGKKKESFAKFMRKSPLVGIDLDLNREQTGIRDLEL